MKSLLRWSDTRVAHVAFLLLVGSALLLNVHLQVTTLSTPDPYDYAQLARNLAEGEGFTTELIMPISWGTVQNLSAHPDLWRAPLYPLMVAASFRLFGVGEALLPAVSSVAFLGFVLVVYRIGDRLFDRWAGFLAGLFVMTVPELTRTAVTGYTEALYLLLVFSSVLLAVRPSRHPYLLGVLSGFAYLTRYNHWFLLVGILVLGLTRLRENRIRFSLKFIGVFLTVIFPWLVRNTMVVGQPFYHHHGYLLASHNPINPEFSVFFQFDPPELLTFVLNHPGVLLQKSLNNLAKLYGWIPRFFRETWVLALLGAWGMSSLVEGWRTRRGALLLGFGVGFVLQAIGLSFVHTKARHFVPFLPVVFLFGAGAVAALLRGRNRWLRVAVVVALLVPNLLYAVTMHPWASSLSEQDYRNLRTRVPAGEPVMTNVPELTAWYADRPSLWIVPFDEAERQYPKYDYVLLSGEVRRNYSPRTNLRRDFLANEGFLREFRHEEGFGSPRTRLYVRRD